MQFVQCEMKSPDENPEKYINDLIKINQRIENCHVTHKKNDVMMIAHVLSKLPKGKKYYKSFIAMSRRHGYSTQTIAEFKKEVFDYWESDIKQDEEAGQCFTQAVNTPFLQPPLFQHFSECNVYTKAKY